MTRSDLRASARAVMAASRGAHLEPEDLAGYRDGGLGAGERERIREHLSVCPLCARTILDMASFPAVEPAEPERCLSEEDVAERWGKFRQLLRAEPAAFPPLAVPDWASPLPPRRADPERSSVWWRAPLSSLRFVQTLAAALLAMTLGVFWTQRPAPSVNPALFELAPLEDAIRRGGGESLRVPAGAEVIILTLALLDRREFPSYEIEISTAGGKTVWRNADLERGSGGVFTVQLPRGFLPAGSYRIEVRGLDGDRRQLLTSYLLEIEYE